ncbi:MAG TPA: TolC family protein [Candidatus Baltobacteraceae bacterium]|nr:TolC family protein [Candidatus Baltobacteraceae bacterium]
MPKLLNPLLSAAFALALLGAAAPMGQPLSLDGALAIAMKQNLQYQQAGVAVDAARARLQQARAPELPALSVQDTYQYVNPIAKLSTPFGSIPFSTVNATNVPLAQLQYTLFDGGVTAARVGQAEAGIAATQGALREARGAVIAAVSKAYFDLVAARDMSEVADRAVAVASGHEREARQLLASGMIPRADLLRAQSELANERVNAIGAHNAVALAQAGLDSVLDVPLDTAYQPTDTLDVPAPTVRLGALLASAHETRGDLLAARASVTAADRAVQAAKGGYAPQVHAMLADGNTQPAVIGGYHNQFSVGLNAVWSLFDNGYTAGRVAEARAGVAQAELGLQELENGVDLQVRQAYLNVNQATAQVDAAKSLVQLADETLRLSQVRYRGGVGTALELQDAELRDRSANETLLSAQVALRESLVQLRFAAGLL